MNVAARKSMRANLRSRVNRRRLVQRIDREITDLSKQIERRIAPLRREIQRAEKQAGSEAARLLREARRRLDAVQVKGHADWQNFLRRSKRDLSKALGQLERSMSPVRRPARRKVRRKKK
jgi:hypothetical protein